ncbi:MAG: hypothetical protein K0Q91_942 [Fibrobacteria bacterium]|jgi:hypothetical protein|nr:hypothetical protein [Fibrobacteria bacterium]
MLKSIAAICALCLGAGHACSFFYFRHLHYETLEPGVVSVLEASGSSHGPAPDTEAKSQIGISTRAGFKAKFQEYLRDSALVFIGRIDSVVVGGDQDTVPSGLSPEVVLASSWGSPAYGGFYLRFSIDTLLKGHLPSRKFWAKAYGEGGSCGVSPQSYGYPKTSFLNVSNKFDNMADLKLPKLVTNCGNCTQAHWFDGRYLVSPDFPGINLDITEVLPTYPATGVLRRPAPARPVTPGGKAYQPDGRRVEEPKSGRNAPLPLLK